MTEHMTVGERSQAAVQFDARLVVRNEGEVVIEFNNGNRAAVQAFDVSVSTDGTCRSRRITVDIAAWTRLDVEQRTRLLRTYVHEVLLDSGFLEVVGGTKVD